MVDRSSLENDTNSWNLFFQDGFKTIEFLGAGTNGITLKNGDYVIKFHTETEAPSVEAMVGQYLYSGNKMKMSNVKYNGPPIPIDRGSYVKPNDLLLNIMDIYASFNFTHIPGIYMELLLTIYNIYYNTNRVEIEKFIRMISIDVNNMFNTHIRNVLLMYNELADRIFHRSNELNTQFKSFYNTLTKEIKNIQGGPALYMSVFEYIPSNMYTMMPQFTNNIGEFYNSLIDMTIQICGTLHGLQSSVKFVHGDISSANIAVKHLKTEETFVYEIDVNTIVTTKTTNLYILIDLGYSDLDSIFFSGAVYSYTTDLHHFGITLLDYIREFVMVSEYNNDYSVPNQILAPIIIFIRNKLLLHPSTFSSTAEYQQVYNELATTLNANIVKTLMQYRHIIVDETVSHIPYWDDPIFTLRKRTKIPGLILF